MTFCSGLTTLFVSIVVVTINLKCIFGQGGVPGQNVVHMESKERNKLFSSARLKCLVCQSMVEEFEWAFSQTSPDKVIDVGSKRLLPNGDIDKKLVKYLRSKAQLDDLVETICKDQMADYAQARYRDTKEALIVRILDHNGGMNPLMGTVDMVPDDDLNTRLQYYCELIVEEEEDHVLAVFADAKTSVKDKVKDLCYNKTTICKKDQKLKKKPKQEL